jgi:hypothetical protein
MVRIGNRSQLESISMQGYCFVDVRDVRCPVKTCREHSSEVVE